MSVSIGGVRTWRSLGPDLFWFPQEIVNELDGLEQVEPVPLLADGRDAFLLWLYRAWDRDLIPLHVWARFKAYAELFPLAGVS